MSTLRTLTNAAAPPRKPVQLPLTSGEEVTVDLQLLTPLKTLEVLEAARREAVARGVAEPDDADPIYLLALQCHTLVACCVDHESPSGAPVPFFASTEELLGSELLARETIAFIFALYEHFVDERALSPSDLTPEALREATMRTAHGDLLFFSRLRPGMQWTFVRSMASLLLASPQVRWGPSSRFEDSQQTKSDQPPSAS